MLRGVCIYKYVNGQSFLQLSKNPWKWYSTSLKKKRNKFNYREKQEIIKDFEKSGYSTYKFAKEININPKTLQNWIRNKEKILSINRQQTKLE